jgi:hypothetical protein
MSRLPHWAARSSLAPHQEGRPLASIQSQRASATRATAAWSDGWGSRIWSTPPLWPRGSGQPLLVQGPGCRGRAQRHRTSHAASGNYQACRATRPSASSVRRVDADPGPEEGAVAVHGQLLEPDRDLAGRAGAARQRQPEGGIGPLVDLEGGLVGGRPGSRVQQQVEPFDAPADATAAGIARRGDLRGRTDRRSASAGAAGRLRTQRSHVGGICLVRLPAQPAATPAGLNPPLLMPAGEPSRDHRWWPSSVFRAW